MKVPTHSYTISHVNVAKNKAWDICFLFYRIVRSYNHAKKNQIFCSSTKQSQLSLSILTAVLWCAVIGWKMRQRLICFVLRSYNRTILHWKDSRWPGLLIYRISSYNCRGNYSFLNSSSEETIQVFISLMYWKLE